MTEPKRTRANGRASRKAIVDAALDVFAERGHRGTTLNEIARRVGMTQPGLLHHFSTKEDLLLEVVRSREEVTARDVSPYLSPEVPDLVTAIETLARHNQEAQVEQLLLTTLTAEAVPADHPLHDHFVEQYRDNRRQLTTALRRGQKQGSVREDVDAAAYAREVIATLDGLRLQWLLDPDQVPLAKTLRAYAKRVAADLAPPQ